MGQKMNLKYIWEEIKANKKFYISFSVIALSIVILGLCIDLKNFGLNLLSCLCFLFVGSMFTLLIVDNHYKLHKKEQWAEVSKITL